MPYDKTPKNQMSITLDKNYIFKNILLFLFSILTPVFLYYTFPVRHFFFLAWIAFVPLLINLLKMKFWPAFFTAYANGLIFYFVFYRWLNQFHPWSIYFIAPFFGFLYFAVPLLLIRLLYLKNKPGGVFIAPAIWVASEFIKSRGNLALPSGDLAMSQVNQLYFIQFADITGQAGISYLIFLVNMALAYLADIIYLEKQKWTKLQTRIFITVSGILFCVFLYGVIKVHSAKWANSMSAGIVQTAHYPQDKWTEKYRDFLREYELAVEALAPANPQFIVFPETALNMFYNFEGEKNTESGEEVVSKIAHIAKIYQIPLVMGGLEFSKKFGTINKYNSIFVFNKDGQFQGSYRKRKLVAFGESGAFTQILPWLQNKINRDSRTIMFEPGKSANLFTISAPGRNISFGNLVCFEASDGSLAREYVKNGADLLLIESSDLWSNSIDGMVQNAAFSVYRAIENRVPVARSSNGGMSFYVDPLGNPSGALPLGQAGIMPVQIQFLQNNFSLYKIFGNWFVYFCFMVSLAGSFIVIKRNSKNK